MPAILEAVFQSTLDLITTNFEDNPDHRTGFYRLLRAVNVHCFLGTCAGPRGNRATAWQAANAPAHVA